MQDNQTPTQPQTVTTLDVQSPKNPQPSQSPQMPQIPQPPTSEMPPQPIIELEKPRSNNILIFGVALLLLAIIGTAIYLFFQSQDGPTQKPTSYEECINAQGSIIQESYPAICVTQDGQRFVQPLSEEEQSRLKPSTATPDLNREPNGSAATVSWETHTNTETGHSFKYPQNWTLNKYDKNGNQFSSQLVLIDPSNGNATGIGSITMLVYDNPKQLSLENYEAEDIERSSPSAQRTVFYRPSGVNSRLGDSTALLLANEECEPGKCDIYLLSIKENVHRILVRYDFVSNTLISQILSTFEFTE